MLNFEEVQQLYKFYNNGNYGGEYDDDFEYAERARRDFSKQELSKANLAARCVVKLDDCHCRFRSINTICELFADFICWVLPRETGKTLKDLRSRHHEILNFNFACPCNTTRLMLSLFGPDARGYRALPRVYIHRDQMFPIDNMNMFKDLPPVLAMGPSEDSYIFLKQPGVDVPHILNSGGNTSNGWVQTWREQSDTSGAGYYIASVVNKGRMERFENGEFVFDRFAALVKKHQETYKPQDQNQSKAAKQLNEILLNEHKSNMAAMERIVDAIADKIVESTKNQQSE